MTIDGETRKLDEVFFRYRDAEPDRELRYVSASRGPDGPFLHEAFHGLSEQGGGAGDSGAFSARGAFKTLEPVCTREEILEAMEEIRKIYVHPEIKKYLVDLAEASRQDGELLSGVSPEEHWPLFKGIRAYAWLKGRDYVVPEDVKALAVPVLAHRLVLAGAGDTDAERRIMEEILKRVEVPVEDWKKK